MSATLIAVVLALFLGHAVTALTQLRRYGWFDHWLEFGSRHLGPVFSSPFSILASLGLPLLVVALIQSGLDGRFYGLPAFLFAVIVLIYCWGPRDLDRDVDAVEEATDEAARKQAIERLVGASEAVSINDEAGLVDAVFFGAMRRWFGVLLWFLLLGPFGAMFYRFAAHGAAGDKIKKPLAEPHAAAYRHLIIILDWPVAHLMTLALAVAGSFDAVYAAWRDWHRQRRGQSFDFSIGFLTASARASARQYRRDRSLEAALDRAAGLDDEIEPVVGTSAALAAMHAAMALVWRILVTWVVVVALFVLAGYV